MDTIINYLALDKLQFEKIAAMNNGQTLEDEIIDYVNDLANDDDIELVDIDRLWDILHFLFTGVSVKKPVHDNPLSEAIVGIGQLDDETFMSLIAPDRIDAIVKAFESFDIVKSLHRLTFDSLFEARLEPYNSKKLEADELIELKAELAIVIEDLVIFYKEVSKNKQGILILFY